LFADFHFFIQAPFFGHVANLVLVFLRQFFSIEKNAVEKPPGFAILSALHPTDQSGYEEEKKVT